MDYADLKKNSSLDQKITGTVLLNLILGDEHGIDNDIEICLPKSLLKFLRKSMTFNQHSSKCLIHLEDLEKPMTWEKLDEVNMN